jgi:hypothetical protein
MGVQKRGPNRYEAFTYVPKAQRKPGEGPKRYIGTYTKRGDAVQAFEDAKRHLRGKPPTDEMTVASTPSGGWSSSTDPAPAGQHPRRSPSTVSVSKRS